ncbi:MAG: NAD-dependent epimerase/dehydratase family protein [Acidimicrobiales bacterium]
MRIFLTGGAGYIGRRTALSLTQAGHLVTASDVRTVGTATPEIETIEVDATDLSELTSAARGSEVIIHLASLMSDLCAEDPLKATKVNAVSAAAVLECAKVLSVPRVIIVSSIAVYGSDARYKSDDLPLAEGATRYVAGGLRVYGATKLYGELLAEHYAATSNMTIIVLRPGVVYGESRRRGKTSKCASLLSAPSDSAPLKFENGQLTVPFVHVDDVADALVFLAAVPLVIRKAPTFLNLGGDSVSIAEIAEMLKLKNPALAPVVESQGPTAGLFGMPTAVADNAIEALGFKRRYSPIERVVSGLFNSSPIAR